MMSNTAILSTIAIITALALVTLAISEPAFAAPKTPKKLTICHDPPGEDDPATPEVEGEPKTITIGNKAALKHLENHDGDTLGPCPPTVPGV